MDLELGASQSTSQLQITVHCSRGARAAFGGGAPRSVLGVSLHGSLHFARGRSARACPATTLGPMGEAISAVRRLHELTLVGMLVAAWFGLQPWLRARRMRAPGDAELPADECVACGSRDVHPVAPAVGLRVTTIGSPADVHIRGPIPRPATTPGDAIATLRFARCCSRSALPTAWHPH